MTVEELLARIDPFELSAWAVLEGIEVDEQIAAQERAKEQAADPGMEVHVSGQRCDDQGNPIDAFGNPIEDEGDEIDDEA